MCTGKLKNTRKNFDEILHRILKFTKLINSENFTDTETKIQISLFEITNNRNSFTERLSDNSNN